MSISTFPYPLAMALVCLLQMMVSTQATLSGKAVVPMGANLPPIEVSFIHRDGEEVDLYIIQSHGIESTEPGFFKVEGPLDCVRLVSEHQVIISGVAMGTAMNQQNFFRVGDTIRLAVSTSDSNHPDSEVSVIQRIPYGQSGDCLDADWTDFQLLHASQGAIGLDM